MWKKIKLILKSLRQYKRPAIITPLFMIVEAALECALPFVMSMFVDTIEKVTTLDDFMTPFLYENTNFGFSINVSLFGLIMTLLGMALVSIACGILGGVFGSKASVGLAANLRSDLYKKMNHSPLLILINSPHQV